MRKAHELAVICSQKVSIICTDFQRSCFTYCNDGRLKPDLEHIFKGTASRIWLNTFTEEQVSLPTISNRLKIGSLVKIMNINFFEFLWCFEFYC